jgi:hypothetical protein
MIQMAWHEYGKAWHAGLEAPASRSLPYNHTTTLCLRAVTDTLLCWRLSSKCCQRT